MIALLEWSDLICQVFNQLNSLKTQSVLWLLYPLTTIDFPENFDIAI